MFELTAKTYPWPFGSRLRFYECSGELCFSTSRRKTDLFDELTAHWPHRKRVVIFGLTCTKHSQSYWSEPLLQFTEGRIRYDFEWEGCKVRIKRLTAKLGSEHLRCDQEFQWKLTITNPLISK